MLKPSLLIQNILPLAGAEITPFTAVVDTDRFQRCAEHADLLLRLVLRGVGVDLAAATQSIGGSIEYLLSDAFRACALPYWFDGFVVEAIELRPANTVFVRGLAWCADHQEQWQVPAEAELRCAPDAAPALRSARVRVGDRATGLVPLSPRAEWPEFWLHDFEIESL